MWRARRGRGLEGQLNTRSGSEGLMHVRPEHTRLSSVHATHPTCRRLLLAHSMPALIPFGSLSTDKL